MTDEDRYCAKETASEEAARMSGGLLTIRGQPQSQRLGDFVFRSSSGEDVARIDPDGTITVNPKWEATDAARVFWDAVRAVGWRRDERAKVPEWVKPLALAEIKWLIDCLCWALGAICIDYGPDEFGEPSPASFGNFEHLRDSESAYIDGLEWAIRIANGGG